MSSKFLREAKQSDFLFLYPWFPIAQCNYRIRMRGEREKRKHEGEREQTIFVCARCALSVNLCR
jgi:hypothetical protein